MNETVTSYLQICNNDFFCADTWAFVSEWDECFDVDGRYIGFWCVPSATLVLRIYWSQNDILSKTVIITSFFLNFLAYCPFFIHSKCNIPCFCLLIHMTKVLNLKIINQIKVIYAYIDLWKPFNYLTFSDVLTKGSNVFLWHNKSIDKQIIYAGP